MRNDDIAKRFDKIEDRQSEFRETIDNVIVNQSEGMKQLKEIHYLLAGTEYNKENGGLVGEVNKIRNKVHTNTAWRIRMTAMGTAVAAIVGFILFKLSSVIATIKELIND